MGPHGTASCAIIQYKQKTERRCPMSHTPSPRPLFGREEITSSVARVDASNVVRVPEDTLKVRKRAASSRSLQNARRAVLQPRRIGKASGADKPHRQNTGQIRTLRPITYHSKRIIPRVRGINRYDEQSPSKLFGHGKARHKP